MTRSPTLECRSRSREDGPDRRRRSRRALGADRGGEAAGGGRATRSVAPRGSDDVMDRRRARSSTFGIALCACVVDQVVMPVGGVAPRRSDRPQGFASRPRLGAEVEYADDLRSGPSRRDVRENPWRTHRAAAAVTSHAGMRVLTRPSRGARTSDVRGHFTPGLVIGRPMPMQIVATYATTGGSDERPYRLLPLGARGCYVCSARCRPMSPPTCSPRIWRPPAGRYSTACP